jgi:hypothetical protein
MFDKLDQLTERYTVALLRMELEPVEKNPETATLDPKKK